MSKLTFSRHEGGACCAMLEGREVAEIIQTDGGDWLWFPANDDGGGFPAWFTLEIGNKVKELNDE